MTIKRVNRGKSHSYVHVDTGQRVPGVTTIIGAGLPKPKLLNWAAEATAEAAVNRWDELAAMPPADRLKTLTKARYANRDAAANRGTAVHDLAEKLVQGAKVAVPDEIAGHVESYVAFLDEWDVHPILIERPVYCERHAYSGTFDLIADLIDPDDHTQRVTALLDIKTSRSGIFGELALQAAAYRYADVYIDEDGEPQPMPEVDMAGGVHVRADGYSLIPVEAGPDQHRDFLYVQQVARFEESSRDLVGAPAVPPTGSTYRLEREA